MAALVNEVSLHERIRLANLQMSDKIGRIEIRNELFVLHGWTFPVPSITNYCLLTSSIGLRIIGAARTFSRLARIFQRDFLISSDGSVVLHLKKKRIFRHEAELGRDKPFCDDDPGQNLEPSSAVPESAVLPIER